MFIALLVLYLALSIGLGIVGVHHGNLWCPGGISIVGALILFAPKIDNYGVFKVLALVSIALTWIAFGLTKLFS